MRNGVVPNFPNGANITFRKTERISQLLLISLLEATEGGPGLRVQTGGRILAEVCGRAMTDVNFWWRVHDHFMATMIEKLSLPTDHSYFTEKPKS